MPYRSSYIELKSLAEKNVSVKSTALEKGWSLPDYGVKSSPAWRKTVLGGAVITVVVLATNIAILGWGLGQVRDPSGNPIFYEGNCESSANIFRLWHLLINILSTLLLGASNACAQVVLAPTRKEVDNAHKTGRWLHIGIAGYSNLRFISKSRVLISVLLALSSLPLHLFYNSTIYSSIGTYNYFSLLVTPEFLNGGEWSLTPWFDPANEENYALFRPTAFQHNIESRQAYISSVQKLVSDGDSSLQPMSVADCLQTFTEDLVSQYRGLIMVTNNTKENQSLLNTFDPIPSSGTGPIWCNAGRCVQGQYSDETDGCSTPISITETWNLPEFLNERPLDYQSLPPNDSNVWSVVYHDGNYSRDGRRNNFTTSYFELRNTVVERCIAIQGTNHCSVGMSGSMLIIVIVCNAVKLSCFVAVLYRGLQSPLVVVGDAIVSFLKRPDPHTKGFGPISTADVRHGWWRRERRSKSVWVPPTRPGRYWEALRLRQLHAIGRRRRALLFFWLFVSLAGGITVSTMTCAWERNCNAVDWRLGKVTYKNAIASFDLTAIATSFIANIPQIGVTTTYLIMNNLITSMISAKEYFRFANRARPLRVSRSEGQQRSTYWLQLPYRYSVPMLAAFAVLHWLVSESLFLINVNLYNPDGTFSGSSNSQLGFGMTGTIASAVLSIVVVVLIMASALLKYPSSMPLIGNCSAAISAACHRAEDEAPDMVLKPLMYGILRTEAVDGKRQVAFSANPVDPLIEGEYYGS